MAEEKLNSISGSFSKRYTSIFFDLDHTLWDYETNSRETLEELYESYNLKEKGVNDLPLFQDEFRRVNYYLWDLYDRGIIANDVIRKERFQRVLGHFGLQNEKLSDALSKDYLNICPKKANLIPHALDVLQYLVNNNYRLSVITNGFEEIQSTKIKSANLLPFFDHIITSQTAGHRKPNREIFEYALSVNKLECCNVAMVGDNIIADMAGARNANIDNIFFNPDAVNHDAHVSHEIKCLSELRSIF